MTDITKPVYRHEVKYLINDKDKDILIKRLEGIIKRDTHADEGYYKVRSLYFDDYWHSSYEEKLMGVTGRNKYRIRIYNDSDRNIRLERKTKTGSYIYKKDASLAREEVEKILDGDYSFLLYHPQPLCKEFYVKLTSCVMRPRVIVDYEREPFVFEAGDVRITFDSNVRASSLSFSIFDPTLPTCSVLDPGKLVLEVKFTEFLPDLIRRALPSEAAELTAVSKFVLGCEKTMYIYS